QVVADGAGPEDAHEEGAGGGGGGGGVRAAGGRGGDVGLLGQKPARAKQADAGRRQVAAEGGELAPRLRAHPGGLDGIDAVLLAAFDGAGGAAVVADQAAHLPADGPLLVLLAQGALADGGGVVVAAAVVAEGRSGEGEHLAPAPLGLAGQGEFGADLARQYE